MKSPMTVPAAIPPALARRRDYVGPALFAYGFRPFFLGAALWSAVGILLWVRQYFGEISLPLGMNALDWHIHEMIYGYVAAAIAGFLLTAIPNWTGRLPVCGLPLAGLALLWAAGRLAMFTSATVGAVSAAVIDVSFLVVLAAFALREIVAGRNWRNLRVLGVLGVLVAGNVVWHVELLRVGARQLRRADRHCGGGRHDHVHRRTDRAELHPQLAGADKSRPRPAAVLALRRDRHRGRSARARAVGRARSRSGRGCRADDRRRVACRAAWSLGRRPHHRGSSGARSARRLRLRPDRFSAARRLDAVAGRDPRERRHSCLDGRRGRADDLGGDDAGEPGPCRPPAGGVCWPRR